MQREDGIADLIKILYGSSWASEVSFVHLGERILFSYGDICEPAIIVRPRRADTANYREENTDNDRYFEKAWQQPEILQYLMAFEKEI